MSPMGTQQPLQSVRPPFAIDARYPTVKSVADIKAAIAAKAKELGPGKWIRGRGWNTALLEEFKNDPKKMPSKKDLDDVAPDNPVILTDWSGHTIWANSKALQLANITRNTPDPDGGKVGKDAAGEPNGMLGGDPGVCPGHEGCPPLHRRRDKEHSDQGHGGDESQWSYKCL